MADGGAAAEADCTEEPSAAVLSGGAAGDCPEADVVRNVTDVNANASEALMNARGIDTRNLPPEAIPIGEPTPGSNGLLAELFPAEFDRGAPCDQQSTTERARPASLVSLYLLFISFAVWASASTVSSKLIRCLDAISLLAIA